MKGCEKYDLNDPKDMERLNKLLNTAGIHFEKCLFGFYVWIDHDRFGLTVNRKAGRRTIINQTLRYKVYNLRCEKKSLRSIAADTGISTATVRKILKDFNPEESTDQLALDI